jgi:hypothetical protein
MPERIIDISGLPPFVANTQNTSIAELENILGEHMDWEEGSFTVGKVLFSDDSHTWILYYPTNYIDDLEVLMDLQRVYGDKP